MSFAWSDADVERLRVGLLDGLSFSRIAADIGRGVTTNACIGKAHRKGLSSSGRIVANDPRRRKHRAKAAAAPQPKPPQPKPPQPKPPQPSKASFAPARAAAHLVPSAPMREIPTPIESRPLTISGLVDSACKWPLWDNDVTDIAMKFYCGAPTNVCPYCPRHFALSITRQFTPAERAANAASRSKRAVAPVHQRT